ncbi:hypothetical protein HPG69_012011 [Diceros bicornis minor]|uniref:Uncharacterized protein n=1 Tax=Diceros bicornis minor TaxID=77932 RepID=A0A7J7EHR0_DICBM|nr:hypothetical protein HPG69_012011 [Diceros bicornis minor]
MPCRGIMARSITMFSSCRRTRPTWRGNSSAT